MEHKRSLADEPQELTPDRIVAAALRCFARGGFAGTSLADIEAEAGLSVGAGSTYRYFRSKQAMLEAAVESALAGADDLARAEPSSLEDAARLALSSMDDLRDLTRIVLRDLDRFPELLVPVVDRLIDGPVREVAARMSAAAPGVDGEAMAALLVGGLVNAKVIEALGGRRPGAVEEERLVRAWAHLYELVLTSAR